jgi:hypothetical protein
MRKIAAGAFLIIFILVSLFHLSGEVSAQRSVKGRVLSDSGTPLEGVYIAAVKDNLVNERVKTGADGWFEVRLVGEANTLLIYYDDVSTPGWDYLPALVDASGDLGELEVRLIPSASVSLVEDLQFVYTDDLPLSVRYEVQDQEGNILAPSGFPLVFGWKVLRLLDIPGLSTSTVVVPAGVSTGIRVNCSIISEKRLVTRVFDIKPVPSLEAGELLQIDIRRFSLPGNLDYLDDQLDEVRLQLNEMGSLGFYLSKQMTETSTAERRLIEAKRLFEAGDYKDCFDAAKRTYIDLKSTNRELDGLYNDASTSVYFLIAFLCAMSISTGFLLKDYRRPQITIGVILYSLLLVSLFYVYPGSRMVAFSSFTASAVLSLAAMLGLTVAFSKLLNRVGKDTVLSSLGIVGPIFSIAKRSIKRRRLRFLLLLFSMMVMVMGFVTLTSFSEGYGLITRTVQARTQPLQGVLLRSSSWSEELSPFLRSRQVSQAHLLGDELNTGWLEGQEEVLAVSLKNENLPNHLYIAWLNFNPLRGVVGIDPSKEDPIMNLSSGLVEGKLPGPGGVVISRGLKEKLGVAVGDNLTLNHLKVTLQGVMDDTYLANLKEMDGSDYLPKKLVEISPMSTESPIEETCEPHEVVLAYIDLTQGLFSVGGSRIAVKLREGYSPQAFAERIALERGYQAWVSTSEGVTYAGIVDYIEGKGFPLLIPWIIVVLNIVMITLNSLFERRWEINILSSIGLNPAHISLIFVAEVGLMGFMAGGLGYLLGFGVYKLMGAVGLALEVHQKVSALWLVASIMIVIAAVFVGALTALKSSIVITPSLERRWRFDKGSFAYNEPWIIKIPLKLRDEQLDDFVDFMTKALKRYEDDPSLATSMIRTERRGDDVLIRFIHKSVNSMVGDIYIRNVLLLKPGPGGEYSVSFESIGNSGMSHMSGSLVRLLTMEWSTRAKS